MWWMSGVVNVLIYPWCGGCLVWWMSSVVDVCVVDVVQSSLGTYAIKQFGVQFRCLDVYLFSVLLDLCLTWVPSCIFLADQKRVLDSYIPPLSLTK